MPDTDERQADLAERQRQAARAITEHAQRLGETIDPKVARDMRDKIEAATSEAVEHVDVRCRLLDRPE